LRISRGNIYYNPRQAHHVPFEESNIMSPCWNIKVNTRVGKDFSRIEQQPAVQLTVTFQKKCCILTDWYKYIKPFRNLCVHPTQSRLHHHLSAIVCRKVFLRNVLKFVWKNLKPHIDEMKVWSAKNKLYDEIHN
jgi:abortive infection bacteriophage resistance protein